MHSTALRFALSIVLLTLAFGACAMGPNFDKLEERLKIRPEQKEQYDLAVGATKRALLGVGLAAMQMKDRLAAELAKSRPDFSSLARAHEEIVEQNRPLFREAGDEWKKLQAILDDEQVEVAKSFLRENLGRLLIQ
jgi:hypothetical protein